VIDLRTLNRIRRWWSNRHNKNIVYGMYKDGCKCNTTEASLPITENRNLTKFHGGYTYAKFIYCYISNTSGDMPPKLENAVISRAISILNSQVDFHIHRLRDNPGGAGYIDGPHGFGEKFTISFVPNEDMINPGALAEASRGFVHVNLGWNWGEDPKTVERYLTYVMVHEMIHAIYGYNHATGSQCGDCVIAPFYADVHPILKPFESHDMYIEYGMNPKWGSNLYRKRKQKLWERDLTEWWKDFKARNR